MSTLEILFYYYYSIIIIIIIINNNIIILIFLSSSLYLLTALVLANVVSRVGLCSEIAKPPWSTSPTTDAGSGVERPWNFNGFKNVRDCAL